MLSVKLKKVASLIKYLRENPMNAVAPHPLFIRVADDLASHGWSQQNVFMPVDLTTELAKECQRFAQTADFSAEFSLQSNQSPAIARYLAIMHKLQQTFSQHLALSLTHYHSYFCCRPSSAPPFQSLAHRQRLSIACYYSMMAGYQSLLVSYAYTYPHNAAMIFNHGQEP